MKTHRERVWRGAGIQFGLFFVVAAVVRGMQPKVGVRREARLVLRRRQHADPHRDRHLRFAFLNLMWRGDRERIA